MHISPISRGICHIIINNKDNVALIIMQKNHFSYKKVNKKHFGTVLCEIRGIIHFQVKILAKQIDGH